MPHTILLCLLFVDRNTQLCIIGILRCQTENSTVNCRHRTGNIKDIKVCKFYITCCQRERERGRERETETETETETERQRDRDRETERDRERQRDGERQRKTETETERQKQTETDRHRQTQRTASYLHHVGANGKLQTNSPLSTLH